MSTRTTFTLDDSLAEQARRLGVNVSAAARALGMERTNLHKRIRALGLSRAK